ncbi:SapC family protein [Pseudocolwellia sp. AS88]|uniref:SapC family protein n=1 Tax=Pseudocolwellia sp. AS88 TaxID=3063958 RepID=UPI0026EFB0CC|nr:SapC family protein [Pseudocolwellia sp. AS88]MDO7085200.1 SapC family protein [Pseudocolwellia sp. AS88]
MANNVPVKSDQHKNLKVASQRSLEHVSDQHIAPINALEFAQAATSYPIILVKEPESSNYRSVVMLGLEAGENLYYSKAKWDAIYVPQSVSLVPFSLGLDPEKEKTLTTCIDLDSPFVGEDKDNALFDADGKETDFFKSAQESLGRLYESEVMTDKFIKELEANDLLLELELSITYNNNQNKKLVGLFGINEQKLTELSDEKVIDFHKRGLFIPIHAMLGSAAQINRLAQLRNQSNSKQKVSGIRFTPVTAEAKK